MTAPVVDSDYLLLWQGGRPVGADALGPWTPERTREVRGKLSAGILTSELLSVIPCPKCRSPMTLVRGSVLHCETCRTTFETKQHFRPEFYAWSANLDYAERKTLEALTGGGFVASPPRADLSRVHGASVVATIVDRTGSEMQLVLASKKVSRELLYQLWGYAKLNGVKIVLVHPGLSTPADQLLEVGVEVSPVFTLEFPRLWDPATASQVAAFPRYRDRVVQALATISAGLAEGKRASGSAVLFDLSDEQVEELSRTGGEHYQLPALKLLMALGPAVGFSKVGWVPDGILLDPGGFWIVDPKSSETGFSFSVPERDKIARYLDLMMKKEQVFGPSLRCRGEIIITRTEPIPQRTIDVATDFIRSRAPGCVVSLVSHEGLCWLRDQIREDPSYWHLRDPAADALNLLTLQPKGFRDGALPVGSRPYVDAPLKKVGPEAFQAYWEYIRSRGLFHGMGGRAPKSVAEMVQAMYVQEFARPG